MASNPIDPKRERISKLQEGLYSRGGQDITKSDRPAFSPHRENLVTPSTPWKEDPILTEGLKEEYVEPKKMSFFTKIFLASIAFFLVASGIAVYVLSGGFNVISSKNVDISVQGLISIAAGEELSLDIIVANNNSAALEQGELFVEYPPGTRTASDLTKELTREKVLIENIPAGRSVTKTVKAVLFGEKDSAKQIKIALDYKAHGSNASFSKEKTYDIAIKSSPVLMEVSAPKEVNAGQDITLTVNITSNSAIPVKNLLLRAEYPFGFNFKISTTGNSVLSSMSWRKITFCSIN
jgi:hypothetical protein